MSKVIQINQEALKEASESLYLDLGNLDDLPLELRNTLANVYYKFYALAMNMRNPSQVLGYDNSDIMSTILGFGKGMADVISDFKTACDLIKALREIINHNKKLYEYLSVATLDILKYKIPNARNKSLLRRIIERKFKKPNEIHGLYELMEKLRNNG